MGARLHTTGAGQNHLFRARRYGTVSYYVGDRLVVGRAGLPAGQPCGSAVPLCNAQAPPCNIRPPSYGFRPASPLTTLPWRNVPEPSALISTESHARYATSRDITGPVGDISVPFCTTFPASCIIALPGYIIPLSRGDTPLSRGDISPGSYIIPLAGGMMHPAGGVACAEIVVSHAARVAAPEERAVSRLPGRAP